MSENKPRIVIIGAGMAGLTAAHKLNSSPSTDHFDISILEANNRIGGRIFSSEFSSHRVEMGATWIHGIQGSPVYEIASSIGALEPEDGDKTPWELMGGYPTEFVTVSEDGKEIDPSVFARVSELYETLKTRAKSSVGPTCYGNSVGSFLRNGLDTYLAEKKQPERELEEAVFSSIYENIERTYTSADDLDQLDASTEIEYKEFPGEHVTIAKGYSRVVESLAARLPAGSIRLGRKVTRIEWSPLATSAPVRVRTADGEVVDADHVIVTVSLGVLKDGGLVFSPSLPLEKAAAIERLGFGVMDKVLLEMENPFPRLLLVFDQKVRPDSKIPWWMRRTAGLLPIYVGARVLHVWLAGKEAIEMEALDEGDVIGGVQATIDAFCPDGRNRIVGMKRSQWARDPLFLGSYSYLAVGSTAEDFDLTAEPLPGKYRESEEAQPLQILFAGEATNRPYYSTTHGAYLSGVREAERLIQFYGGNQ